MKPASTNEKANFMNCQHYSPDGYRRLKNVEEIPESKMRGKETTNTHKLNLYRDFKTIYVKSECM